jgi:hypothetical protein
MGFLNFVIVSTILVIIAISILVVSMILTTIQSRLKIS